MENGIKLLVEASNLEACGGDGDCDICRDLPDIEKGANLQVRVRVLFYYLSPVMTT